MRALAVIAALAGCGQSPAATSEFWGPTILPPRGLAQLAPGMRVAEAKRLVPALHEPRRPGLDGELVVDSGVSDVKLVVRVDAGVVASIIAIVRGHGARESLTRAWGEPQITRDALGQPEITWASETTGWKVKLDCMERNCLVEYTPYHVLTSEFFGPHVVPPGDLAKLHIGMSVAEARILAPGPVSARAGIATKYDDVREYVAIDDTRGTVRSIYLNLPPEAEDLIAAAWGPGAPATWPVNRAVKVWPDPTTGWRAMLRPALGKSRDLVFDNYLPIAALLGDHPDTLEVFTEPVIGHSTEAIKRQLGRQVTTHGRTLVVSLPPTEWSRELTRITLDIAGGRVRQLELAVPYKSHPPARDQLFELFTGKWGVPEHVPSAGGATFVFRQADPRVEVRDDLDRGAWLIAMR